MVSHDLFWFQTWPNNQPWFWCWKHFPRRPLLTLCRFIFLFCRGNCLVLSWLGKPATCHERIWTIWGKWGREKPQGWVYLRFFSSWPFPWQCRKWCFCCPCCCWHTCKSFCTFTEKHAKKQAERNRRLCLEFEARFEACREEAERQIWFFWTF